MIDKLIDTLHQLKEVHDFLGDCTHAKGFNAEVMAEYIARAQIGITNTVAEISYMLGDEIAGIEFYGESNFGTQKKKGV